MTQQSLADLAVETLAAVAAIGEGVTINHPERHIVRDLKREAEALISNALRSARALTYAAEGLRELHRKQEAEKGQTP